MKKSQVHTKIEYETIKTNDRMHACACFSFVVD